MMKELNESWVAHMNSTYYTASVEQPDASALQAIQKIQLDVAALRERVEGFALNALNQVPGTSSHWHNNAHETLRTVGLIPSATAADLAKVATDASVMKQFNPMLSLESREHLALSILIWLQLCVYEDKLRRLASFFRLGCLDEMMRELETKTVWDVTLHPYWLIFEAENGIQIRQEQYKVAQHLIGNPGDVIQLNMGLGKVSIRRLSLILGTCISLPHPIDFDLCLDKGDTTNVDLTCIL